MASQAVTVEIVFTNFCQSQLPYQYYLGSKDALNLVKGFRISWMRAEWNRPCLRRPLNAFSYSFNGDLKGYSFFLWNRIPEERFSSLSPLSFTFRALTGVGARAQSTVHRAGIESSNSMRFSRIEGFIRDSKKPWGVEFPMQSGQLHFLWVHRAAKIWGEQQ